MSKERLPVDLSLVESVAPLVVETTEAPRTQDTEDHYFVEWEQDGTDDRGDKNKLKKLSDLFLERDADAFILSLKSDARNSSIKRIGPKAVPIIDAVTGNPVMRDQTQKEIDEGELRPGGVKTIDLDNAIRYLLSEVIDLRKKVDLLSQ